MKLNHLITKCLEAPEISIKNNRYSVELLLNHEEGKGSMTFFQLFPGMMLAYIFINSPSWPAPNLQENQNIKKAPFVLNYCINGRCEMFLNDENFVYVKDGEISLSECFAQRQYVYPRKFYEGLEFFIDLPTLITENELLLQSFCLDFAKLSDIYCSNGKTYITHCSSEIEPIFKKLWTLYDKDFPYALNKMRIHTLDLFSSLLNENNKIPPKSCTFYTETQVNIAKKTEQIITSDIHKHHPAWELAASFSVSETSLKNYFRGVYGQNISVYMREVRMNKAAELLLSTTKSVAEIAELVGYSNQSKFAAVFKKQFQVAPLEYKRKMTQHKKQSSAL